MVSIPPSVITSLARRFGSIGSSDVNELPSMPASDQRISTTPKLLLTAVRRSPVAAGVSRKNAGNDSRIGTRLRTTMISTASAADLHSAVDLTGTSNQRMTRSGSASASLTSRELPATAHQPFSRLRTDSISSATRSAASLHGSLQRQLTAPSRLRSAVTSLKSSESAKRLLIPNLSSPSLNLKGPSCSSTRREACVGVSASCAGGGDRGAVVSKNDGRVIVYLNGLESQALPFLSTISANQARQVDIASQNQEQDQFLKDLTALEGGIDPTEARPVGSDSALTPEQLNKRARLLMAYLKSLGMDCSYILPVNSNF